MVCYKNRILDRVVGQPRTFEMKKSGFALLEILIVIIVLMLLMLGTFYFKSSFSGQKPLIETGKQAIDQAKDLKARLETRCQDQSSTLEGL